MTLFMRHQVDAEREREGDLASQARSELLMAKLNRDTDVRHQVDVSASATVSARPGASSLPPS